MQVVDNQVVLVRTKEREGYTALQVGAVDHPKIKRVSYTYLNGVEIASFPVYALQFIIKKVHHAFFFFTTCEKKQLWSGDWKEARVENELPL